MCYVEEIAHLLKPKEVYMILSQIWAFCKVCSLYFFPICGYLSRILNNMTTQRNSFGVVLLGMHCVVTVSLSAFLQKYQKYRVFGRVILKQLIQSPA